MAGPSQSQQPQFSHLISVVFTSQTPTLLEGWCWSVTYLAPISQEMRAPWAGPLCSAAPGQQPKEVVLGQGPAGLLPSSIESIWKCFLDSP